MGDYTGLRFAAKLKPQAIPIIQLLNDDRPNQHGSTWASVAQAFPLPELLAWQQVHRCDFIPFGGICYLPDEWDDQSADGNSLLDGDVWRVVCSLKNYNNEIECFMLGVLPILLAEPCCCEVMFEAWDEPRITMVEPREFRLPAGAADKQLER
jgi:hypothetical protein